MKPDAERPDLRRVRGRRVIFRHDQGEAWRLAQIMARRLSPMQIHLLHILAQCFIEENMRQAMEAEQAQREGVQ